MSLWPRVRAARTLTAEWLWLALLLGALVAAASLGQWLQRLDRVAYDAAMTAWQRPAPKGIVVVAIDQDSLDAIGRWPWSRALHAALIDRLAQARPAAMLLDVILAETDAADPASDAALAAALARAGNVALPVYAQMQPGGGARLLAPHPALAQAAAALGHIHLELDGDGVARRVYLDEIGSQIRLPHLALATLALADRHGAVGRARAPASAAPTASGTPQTALAAALALGNFEPQLRHQRELAIAFAGAPGHFQRVPYAAVLRGEVPAEQLAGRIVLIGATAPGLGDSYPTPLSGHGVAMPGVEIMANVIDTLQQGIDLREANALALALAAVALTWAMLGALVVLAPRAALWATLAAAGAVALGVLAGVRLAGWWWAPSAALLGIFLAYPLWSWRRLEAASRFLDDELAQHERDAGLGLALMPPEAVLASDVAVRALPARSTWRDVFDRRLGLAHSAAAALRQSREVFAQSLAGLPMAVVVCDASLHVFLANDAARHLLGAGEVPLPQRLAALQAAGHDAPPNRRNNGPSEPSGRTAVTTMATTAAGATAATATPAALAHWRDAIARVLAEGNAVSHPLQDASGRSWLVSIAPYARVGTTTVGAIVTLMDVTELQRLQREERDFLQFLSHDLRAPPHSVLSLVDLALAGQPAEPMPGLLARIARHAERSLALLDALLMQQRADRIDPQEFRHHDLAQMLHEVADQLWPRLQAQGQHLVLTGADQPAWVRGRGELLLRALSNLSINASNYSGRGSRIELSLQRLGEHWLCAVSDNGPGIAAEHLPRLFDRHFRAPPPPSTEAVGGSGLGLAFVKTVALRHAGRIEVNSLVGQGATFTLTLPAFDDEDVDDSDDLPS